MSTAVLAEGEMGQVPAAQLEENLRAISDRCMRLLDLDTRSLEEILYKIVISR